MKKNDTIQGLRALAALSVVAAHSIDTLIKHAGLSPAYPWLSHLLGSSGVRIFFIISGYIMASTMWDSFAQPGASRVFVIKRLIRIAPIYWLTTLAFVAISVPVAHRWPSSSEMWHSLLFVPYVNSHGLWQPIYGLGWTLNYEMFFYGLFAVALYLPRHYGLASIVAVLSGLTVLGLIGVEHFYTRPITLYFAAGIGLVVLRRRLTLALPSLSNRLLAALGDASYSIYLTHAFVIGLAGRLWGRYFGHEGSPIFIALMLCAASLVALAVYRYFERPMLTVLRRWCLPGKPPRLLVASNGVADHSTSRLPEG